MLRDRRHRGEVTHRDRQGAALAAKKQRQPTRSGDFICARRRISERRQKRPHHKSEEIRVSHRDRSL